MYRDPSEFRERFKAYKEGKSVREIYGLPGYAGGKFDAATKKKIDYYYKKLRSNGFDMMSAIGILGNMMQESSLDPNVVNHLGYHGLLLNSKAIQNAIKNLYGDLSEQSQLRYLSDWTDGATWIRKGPYASDTALYSKSYLRSGYKTPEQAAYEFLKRYERAIVVDPKTKKALRDANGNYVYLDKDKRLGYAKSIYNYLSGRPDGIQDLIALVGATQPEPITVMPDATRVTPVPTIQQLTVPSTWILQATELPSHTFVLNFEMAKPLSIQKLVDTIEEYTPTWDKFKNAYAGGKLPGYQNGLTRRLIEDIIVQNQGTILQGHYWSPLSTVANSMYRDYRKPFILLFTEGGLGNFARGFQQLLDSWNKEVIGKKYGFPVGKKFDSVVKKMPNSEIEEIASQLSAYNKHSSEQRLARANIWPDLIPEKPGWNPLVQALTKVPATITIPLLAIDQTNEYKDGKLPGYSNGKIRIKPANRGKFNATKKRTGKTTEELTHSKNPLTRKRAIFAQNARKWKH